MELLILLGLTLINAVFVMSELAVISSRRARLQALVDAGDRRAKTVLELMDNPDRFLSTVQIGITLIGTLAGVFGGAAIAEDIAVWIRNTLPALAPYADPLSVAAITLLTVYLTLVIGELVPKRLAIQNPERIACTLAAPMQRLSRLTAPLVALLTLSSNLVIRLLGVKPPSEPAVTEVEVLSMIEQGIEGGIFEASEQQMVQGVFELDARQVREIVTPRPDIVWLDIDDTRDDIRRKLSENVYSAYPVCRDGIDNVLGVVHSRELLLHVISGGDKVELTRIMQPPLFIPEAVTVSRVLRRFKESGIHIALIVGEDGGVEGLVTLNDIVAEILGAMDQEDPQFTKREDGSWLIDGYMPIARFTEMFPDIQLPENEEGEYQSVAGFVLARLGRIPAAAEGFVWQGYTFEVVDMDGVRIDKVLIRAKGDNS
ncbi:MAG: hemolysin family protein [Anaerolineae bacterium]|nr:hemolysin family protein [Anaerolineae bacterium]